MKLFRIFSGLILIHFFLFPFNSMASDCSYCCSRSATLENFQNLHAPDYEDDEEKWRECMNEKMEGESTFSPDNPRLKKALEYCKHLEPEIWSQSRWHYMRPESLVSKLIMGLETEYFNMAGMGYVFGIPILGDHEYSFNGSFEAMIKDGSIIDDDSSVSGKPVKSRFILELYYNGESKELVEKWVSERSTNTVDTQFRKMILEADAKMSKDKPIHDKLLWEFEKTPVKCEVKPEKKELIPSEVTTLKISSFKDRKDRTSREFNRIVVHVPKREGVVIDSDSVTLENRYWAYIIGDETVNVSYSAPASCDSEPVIEIYNSCDMLDSKKVPIWKTKRNKLIAKHKMKIICPKGHAIFTKTLEQTDIYDFFVSNHNFKKKNVIKRIQASVLCNIKKKHGFPVGINGEYMEYYDLSNCHISSFNFIYSGNGHGDQTEEGFTFKTIWDFKASKTIKETPKLLSSSSVMHLLWNNDKKEKPLPVHFPGFEIVFDWVKYTEEITKDIESGKIVENEKVENKTDSLRNNSEHITNIKISGNKNHVTASGEHEWVPGEGNHDKRTIKHNYSVHVFIE